MLHILNRRELWTTHDSKTYNQIRDILAANHIECATKVVNRLSPTPFQSSRAKHGSLGVRQDQVNQFILYVHKKDYEMALHLVRKHVKL